MTAAARQLSCREVTDFLGAYVAGELGALERAAFDAHLAECPNCRTYLRQYEQTRRLAKEACDDALEAGVPEELVASILAARSRPPDGR